VLYRNFDVWIEAGAAAARYRLRAASEVHGEARGEFGIERTDDVLRTALEQLDTRSTDHESLMRWGAWLYSHLFPENIKALFLKSLGQVEATEDWGLRLRLRIDEPAVARLPWEFLYSPTETRFLATMVRCPVVRYLEIARPLRRTEAPLPLRMLVAIPGPMEGFPPISVDEEMASVDGAVAGLTDRLEVHVVKGHVSWDRLSGVLLEHEYHVFHFVGHGTFRNDRGYLVLNGPEGDADLVEDARFSGLFINHPTMKLVVLNACKGARVSATQPLVGVAPRLVEAGIPAVVAMQFALRDDAAVRFAQEFYRALLKGVDRGRIEVATSHARNALAATLPDDRELGTPVLFMRCPDGLLFDPVGPHWWHNLAFSRAARHTERLVEATHQRNLLILRDELRERPEDPALRTDLEGEQGELKRLHQRQRLRNAIVVAAVAVALLMFFLSIVRAFDILDLDTRLETLTIALGDAAFPRREISPQLAVVALDGETERDLHREFDTDPTAWRADHAKVIHKLVVGGAAVIAVGIDFETFDTARPGDVLLRDAMTDAEHAGTPVLLSARELFGDTLRVPAGLREAAAGVGLGCVGKKLGFAATTPLLVQKPDGSSLPSLALLAVSAFRGVSPGARLEYRRDGASQTVVVETPGQARGRFGYSERTASRRDQGDCLAIRRGDVVADRLIALSPVDSVLRAPGFYHHYSTVLGEDDPTVLRREFSGKLVLLGAMTPRERFRARQVGGGLRYGFDLYADALDGLLRGTTIRPLGPAGQFAIMVAMALIGGFLRYGLGAGRRRAALVLLGAITAAYLALSVYVYGRYWVLLNPLYHIGALWLTFWIAGKAERKWLG
jgi:CHASE2 domain-containing sensor protein